MNFDLMRSLLIDRALRGELFSYSNSIAAEEKSLNEVKETPFTIPNNWQWKRVDDCVQFNPKVIQDDAAEVSFIPMADVEPGFVDHCSTRQIKLWAKVKKGFSRFQEGDLLVAKITPCFQNRKSCVAKNLISGTGAGSTEFHVMRCVSDVDAKFLLYFFKSEYFIRYGVNHFNGTVGQQRVGAQDIKDCLIPVPPFDEQARIVAKLEEAFSEIDRAEKAYEELQMLAGVLRGQILQEAIQGKLVPQLAEEGVVEQIGATPEEVPFEIPEKWKWYVLDQIGEFKKGPFGSALTKSMFVPDGPNAVRVYEQRNAIEKDSQFARYFITQEYYEAKMKSFTVSAGDLIVSCAGTIGEIYQLPVNAKDGIINQALMRVRLTDVMIGEYFQLVFASLIRDLCIAESGGTAIKNIPPFKVFKQFPIPVPPVQEQCRIVQKVRELMEYVDSIVDPK